MQKSKIKNSMRIIKNENLVNQQVILVDKNDKEIGVMEKMEAHKKGLLHRAVSVVVVNSKSEILLQKRNKNKYHSGGLWTNTCCSHPRPGENNLEAAGRRLFEEMGIECKLREVFIKEYKVCLDHDLWENEMAHIFIGNGDNLIIKPDKVEVEDWKWINQREILEEMKKNSEKYTKWFIKWYPQFLEILEKFYD